MTFLWMRWVLIYGSKLNKDQPGRLARVGTRQPADDNIILQRALRLRNPTSTCSTSYKPSYYGAQAHDREARVGVGSAADDEALDDALLVTINGMLASHAEERLRAPSRAFLPLRPPPDAHRTAACFAAAVQSAAAAASLGRLSGRRATRGISIRAGE